MKGFRRLCYLFMIAGLSALTAEAQSPAGPATIRAAGGLVEVSNGNNWIPATRDQSVEVGQRVRTGLASFAYVVAGQDKAVTLTSQTEIEFRDTGGQPAVFLEQGGLKVASGTEITVATKDSTFGSLGGPVEFQITYRDNTADVTVVRGAVRSGGSIFRAAADSGSRTYVVGGQQRHEAGTQYANVQINPYVGFWVGDQIITRSRGYSPFGILPRMKEPFRPPVHPRAR